MIHYGVRVGACGYSACCKILPIRCEGKRVVPMLLLHEARRQEVFAEMLLISLSELLDFLLADDAAPVLEGLQGELPEDPYNGVCRKVSRPSGIGLVLSMPLDECLYALTHQ